MGRWGRLPTGGPSNALGGYGGWNTHPVGRGLEGRWKGVGRALEVAHFFMRAVPVERSGGHAGARASQ